jgi:hypothetical protein
MNAAETVEFVQAQTDVAFLKALLEQDARVTVKRAVEKRLAELSA